MAGCTNMGTRCRSNEQFQVVGQDFRATITALTPGPATRGCPMPQAPPIREDLVRFGEYELDRRAGELRKGEERIRLQEQCLQILTMLLAHPGEVVTREEL